MTSIYLLLGIIIFVIIGYIVAFIYGSTEQMIFDPRRRYISRSSLPHKKVMIDGRLSAWHFNNYPGNKTILFCHGNYGNISYNDFVIELCDHQKLNLLIFDYSGYGRSHGLPNQKVVPADGERAYAYLRRSLEPDEIIIWGMSLGGAVAIYVASRNPCHSLIAMSTFSSLDDIAVDGKMIPFAPLVFGTVGAIVDKMPSKERIRHVKCPIIVMHSRDDEFIPFSNAERLFNNISHPCKKFIEIGGGHASPIISDEILKDLFTFCCIDATHCHLSKEVLESLRNIKEYYLQREAELKDRRSLPSASFEFH